MDLKIWYFLILLNCLASFIKTNDTKHEGHSIGMKMAVEALAEMTSNISMAFSSSNLLYVGDIAIGVVEALPVVCDIIHTSINDSNPPLDVKIALLIINDNLHNLRQYIENVGFTVEKIINKINHPSLKNQVERAQLEISNCHNNFIILLKYPESKAEQDRLKSCSSKLGFVRQIGILLKNQKLAFMTKPLFDQVIEFTGYCYGKSINKVFQYLLGIYIEGCISLTTSEILSSGNETTTFQSECTETIRSANRVQATFCKATKNIEDPGSDYDELKTFPPKSQKDTLPGWIIGVVTSIIVIIVVVIALFVKKKRTGRFFCKKRSTNGQQD